jgi:hypothetical protein
MTLDTDMSAVPRSHMLSHEDFTFYSNQGSVSYGDFVPNPNVLETAVRPFTIAVAPNATPERLSSLELPPTYDCIKSVGARGGGGRPAAAGALGPSLTAYVTFVETPFYRRLIAVRLTGDVSGLSLAPADRSLILHATGGAGGNGITGSSGHTGTCGRSRSSARDGTDGGPGGDAGPGGPGGHITVIIDQNFPELQELLFVNANGGSGGWGGSGGSGGDKGKSYDEDNKYCGRSGSNGSSGQPGRRGSDGTTSVHLGDVSDAFSVLGTAEGVAQVVHVPADTP